MHDMVRDGRPQTWINPGTWLRDLDLIETMESVGFGGHRITAQRVAVVRKALHDDPSKPAEFAPNAGQLLLDQCSVEGDNIWFVAIGGGQTGPIVLLNCTFKGNGRLEGHQRWSTGVLLYTPFEVSSLAFLRFNHVK